jgi:hypothetical protein
LNDGEIGLSIQAKQGEKEERKEGSLHGFN